MLDLTVKDAFAGLSAGPSDAEAEVWIQSVPNARLATLIARKESAAAVSLRVRGHFGVDLPDGPRAAFVEDLAFVGVGPGAWLAVALGGRNVADELVRLAAPAMVVDQSGGHSLVRVVGPRAAELLSRGVFLDLDPSIFAVAAAAGVNIAHAPVLLWRAAEEEFVLAVPRSFVPAVTHWLSSLIGEFKVAVRTPYAPGLVKN